MRYGFGAYAVGYLILTVATIYDDIRSRSPFWETLIDAVLLPAGLAGVLFYWFGYRNEVVQEWWRGISVVLVIGLMISNFLTHFLPMRKGAPDIGVIQKEGIAVHVVVLAILTPMFAMNILWAYGPSRIVR